MPPRDSLALHLIDGQVAPPANPYGRLIANAGTFRALARHGGWQHLHFQALEPPPSEVIAGQVLLGGTGPRITTGPLLSTAAAAAAGTLLSAHAYLSDLAWIRRHAGKDADYSIVGTMFAFASPTHRELMLSSLLAPIHEWDAIICSSPTLQRTVTATIDAWEEHLRERLGPASTLTRPQLPVIAIGSEVAALARRGSDEAMRASMRTQLGISPDTIVVFSLGRLSYYDKAFPQAMFKAIQRAHEDTRVPVHFLVAGWFPDGDAGQDRFEEAARHYSPSVPLTVLDGNDQAAVARCWAAADAFLLLSDTILETFGQVLVEAMSAGLPIVASDWDGYRWIVRDGVDGFLVPTLGAAPGPMGEALALLQSVGAVNYGQYAGAVAQHTAVDVAAAAGALARLISSPGLRRSMGLAGQRRARERFDWPVVVGQYVELFERLGARRALACEGAAATRMNPLRDDPFQAFAGLPSRVLTDGMRLRRGVMGPPDPVVALDGMFPGVRGTQAEAHRVVALVEAQPGTTVGDVLGSFPASRRAFVRMTIAWLAKSGAVEWTARDESSPAQSSPAQSSPAQSSPAQSSPAQSSPAQSSPA